MGGTPVGGFRKLVKYLYMGLALLQMLQWKHKMMFFHIIIIALKFIMTVFPTIELNYGISQDH